jgi:energy-converting hydrogenase B subunit D
LTALLVVELTLLGVSGLITVLIRDPARQALALGVFGLLLGLVFFTVQAPDVALSEIVVGSIALPAMLFLAMAKIGAQEAEQDEESGESEGK